jgi:threonine/homoserine/homoserine lactone efflux protein
MKYFMNTLLPHWPVLSTFIAASFILAITPGPGVLYVVTRSLVQGRLYGLLSVFGVALGNFGNACIASLGLATLFAVSMVAFITVKYIGALYLVYLGVKMWRSSAATEVTVPLAIASSKRIFIDGFIVALFNPKTTIFYAAFLPLFLDPNSSTMLQGITLSAIFVSIAAVTDSMYALAASVVAPLLRGKGLHSAGKRLGGSVFIGLGVLTALAGSNNSK